MAFIEHAAAASRVGPSCAMGTPEVRSSVEDIGRGWKLPTRLQSLTSTAQGSYSYVTLMFIFGGRGAFHRASNGCALCSWRKWQTLMNFLDVCLGQSACL